MGRKSILKEPWSRRRISCRPSRIASSGFPVSHGEESSGQAGPERSWPGTAPSRAPSVVRPQIARCLGHIHEIEKGPGRSAKHGVETTVQPIIIFQTIVRRFTGHSSDPLVSQLLIQRKSLTAMTLPFTIPPGLLAPDFTMSPITDPDEAQRIAEVYYAAFQTDPSNTYWWSADTPAMMEWMVRRIRRQMADPSVRHFKVVDASGDLVAFARWDVPKGSVAFGEWMGGGAGGTGGGMGKDVTGLVEGEAEVASDQKPLTGGAEVPQPSSTAATATLDAPRGADPELCRGFFDGLSRMSDKWMRDDMLGKQAARCPPDRGFAMRVVWY